MVEIEDIEPIPELPELIAEVHDLVQVLNVVLQEITELLSNKETPPKSTSPSQILRTPTPLKDQVTAVAPLVVPRK